MSCQDYRQYIINHMYNVIYICILYSMSYLKIHGFDRKWLSQDGLRYSMLQVVVETRYHCIWTTGLYQFLDFEDTRARLLLVLC